MKRLSALCVVLLSVVLLSVVPGCVSQEDFNKCVRRNDIQQQRILELEAMQEGQFLTSEQFKQKYESMLRQYGGCEDQIAALNAALAKKDATIAELAEKFGKVALPAELNSALMDWASQAGSDLVTFDSETGIVRFKSDLLFDKGQDTVSSQAIDQLKSFAGILKSSAAEGFDVLIVGHTDDIPIKKPDTRVKHPTNWHLSAHRAIAVEDVLASNGMPATRIAVMGMGQYRPIEPNKPGQKGNPKNRRVEIYIVPAGQININN